MANIHYRSILQLGYNMRVFALIQFLFLASDCLGQDYDYSGVELQESLEVSAGEGFILHINTDPSDTPITQCTLERIDQKHDLTVTQESTIVLPTGEKIQSMDPLECGVRVWGVTDQSSGLWRLSTTQTNESTKIEVIPVVEGCDMRTDVCTVTPFDPEESPLPCAKFNFIDRNDYRCDFLTPGTIGIRSIEELTYIPKSSSPTRVTRSGKSIILECRFKEGAAEHCTVTNKRTNSSFNIQNGLQNHRYSSYKTDLKRGICQFEIPLPVNEKEAGTWHMEVGDHRELRMCEFSVVEELETAKMRLLERINSTVIVKTTKKEVPVKCADNVYYPIKICYLMGSGKVYMDSRISEGNCEFDVEPGNWTCGFNAENPGDADLVQRIEVIQYDSEVIDDRVRVENGTTILECHFIEEKPIQWCMFLSPSYKVYRPPSDSFASDKFSYFDSGRMATGDCGIQFKEGVDVEHGTWECIIQREQKVYKAQIEFSNDV